jgi:WD40 repeat protein
MTILRKKAGRVGLLIMVFLVALLASGLAWWRMSSAARVFCAEVEFPEQDAGLLCLACSPRGDVVVTGGSRETLTVWDLKHRVALRTLAVRKEAVRAVAFTADGQILASGSEDGVIRLWDAATWRVTRVLHSTAGVTCLSFLRDRGTLASGGNDGAVSLWNISSGGVRATLAGKEMVTGLACAPDGSVVAIGSADGLLRLWDVHSRKTEVLSAGSAAEGARCVAFLGDNESVAAGDETGTLSLWKLRTGLVWMNLSAHAGPVKVLCYDSRRGLLISAGLDRNVKAWQPASGSELTSRCGDAHCAVQAMGLDSDEQNLVLGFGCGLLKSWSMCRSR